MRTGSFNVPMAAAYVEIVEIAPLEELDERRWCQMLSMFGLICCDSANAYRGGGEHKDEAKTIWFRTWEMVKEMNIPEDYKQARMIHSMALSSFELLEAVFDE